jgi:hypothetical protein
MCLPPLSLLERRGHTAAATFHLSKGVAKELKGKAAYTRTRGLNPIRYAEMVREYLRDHQQIANAELRELLGLGNSPSAQVEASRYLKKWCQADGFLVRHRVRGAFIYTLRPAPAQGALLSAGGLVAGGRHWPEPGGWRQVAGLTGARARCRRAAATCAEPPAHQARGSR